MSGVVGGIERAIFGPVASAEIDDWLDRLARSRLSAALGQVLFRSGRISAVYGIELTGGRRVVVKVHRGHPPLASLAAAAACQSWLAAHGYPAPVPLAQPTDFGGHVAAIETLLTAGSTADGHDPSVRDGLADSLAEQIRLLRTAAHLAAGLTVRPAWAVYDHGPWPVPHDPIFDFTITPPDHAWLDAFARLASQELVAARLARCIGHGDWGSGNVLLADGRVSATFDWDSLMVDSEPVIVGLAAGSFTADGAPAPAEVAEFLADYDRHRGPGFDRVERAVALNSALWVLAYNARCELSLAGAAGPPRPGSCLAALHDHRQDYRALLP